MDKKDREGRALCRKINKIRDRIELAEFRLKLLSSDPLVIYYRRKFKI